MKPTQFSLWILSVGIGICGNALAADQPLQWQRDPFNLPELNNRGLTSDRIRIPCPSYLKLEGIMGGNKAPQAFINGDIFGLGQSVKGYTVSRISEKAVTLQSKKFICSLTIRSS